MARKATRRSTSTTSPKTSRTRPRAASPFYGDVLGIAGSLLRNRQEAGAEKINSLAGAARSFAADLTDIPHIQTYVDAAAEQMEFLSDYVSETSMETMVEDATDFARRHPVATAAFAVAAGFGFTRLMTHHSRHQTAENARGPKTTRGKAKTTASRERASTKATAKTTAKTTAKARGNGRDSARESMNAS
jgi:hypothetical protein